MGLKAQKLDVLIQADFPELDASNRSPGNLAASDNIKLRALPDIADFSKVRTKKIAFTWYLQTTCEESNREGILWFSLPSRGVTIRQSHLQVTPIHVTEEFHGLSSVGRTASLAVS